MILVQLPTTTKRLLLLAILTFAISACEDSEDRTLAEAEACINSATASTVDACMTKVAGMESEDAYLIRCSANFIRQGITESRLSSAFSGIKGTTNASGTPVTTVALSYLIFDNAITNHKIADAKTNCLRANTPSLYRILLLSEIGTEFATALVVPTTTPSPEDLKTAVGAYIGNGGSPTTIGNMAITIRDQFCVSGSAFNSTDVCTKMNAAYAAAGGDPTTVGNQIIGLLD